MMIESHFNLTRSGYRVKEKPPVLRRCLAAVRAHRARRHRGGLELVRGDSSIALIISYATCGTMAFPRHLSLSTLADTP